MKICDKTGVLTLAKEFHVLESLSAAQESAQGNDQDIEQVMPLGPFNSWVL